MFLRREILAALVNADRRAWWIPLTAAIALALWSSQINADQSSQINANQGWAIYGFSLRVLGVVLLAVGLPIGLKASKLHVRFQKYEFEHRTGAGVVEFETYEASVKHNRLKALASLTMNFGWILVLIGIFMLSIQNLFNWTLRHP